MSREKPPSPPVVSTGCSSLMSCLSGHRRGPHQQQSQPAPARRSVDDGAGAAVEVAERCWKRVQILEEEVKRLGGHDEKRPPPPRGAAATTQPRFDVGGEAATDRVGNCGATATRCAGVVGHGGGGAASCGVQEEEVVVVRLEDGSYMREVMREVRRPWDQLAVQVSRPVVPADAASASEVLDKMTAMKAEDLCKFLIQLMPLKDITGEKNPGERVCRRTARSSSTGDDLVEALVVNAMDKLEALVLEGLKIQMASPPPSPATTAEPVAGGGDGRRGNAVAGDVDCMVHVVLMQARDPKERYGAIGDPMIGLIEASLEKNNNATARLRVRGLHVAGISFVKAKATTGDGRCVMWSAYLRRCKELRGGDGDDGGGCRCTCVRHPNRVFKR